MHHHGAGLRVILTKAGLAPADQDALVLGLESTTIASPGLSPREHALLAYADVLTLTPWAVGSGHIHALRDAGCDDRAIHDACAIISYFAFVNRIADGLGVELEG
ncbi:MAG: peroxidase [Acidobacteriota bacterium]|nr:peroxidase [Acidobacteriota bacterium]